MKILQIEFSPSILAERDAILQNRGYQVISILGGNNARNINVSDSGIGVVVIGHGAPRTEREQYEFADRNPITAVRQSGKRQEVPVLLEVAELHRLFDQLELRERAMIVCDALTGMRRSELMGLQWCDLDFFEMRINIVRSVVDQVIGNCKTEASRKPVVMDEHIAQVLKAWRQESVYTASTDWVWASPQKKGRQPLWLATVMRYYIQPAARRAGITKKIGWHTFRHTFSTLIKSLGVDAKVVQELLQHASFKTTMDGYTQALEAPKRQAQAALADLIMRTGKVGHA
jgi:integrase